MTRGAVAAGAVALALATGAVVEGLHASSSSPARPGTATAETVASASAELIRSTAATGRSVPQYGVFVRTFHWVTQGYGDPWEQVQLNMDLTSPSRHRYRIGGFYLAPNQFQVRYAPSAAGRWTWRAQITDGRRQTTYHGVFDVARSKNPGFVRRSPYNRFRWTFDNRTPYYPVGIGDCVALQPDESSPLARWGLDGGFRPAGVHTEGRMVGMDTYMRAYQSAGVNLFRWSVDNCSFPLYQKIDPSGNVYLQQDGIWGDELVQALRSHGFRIYMTFFNEPPFSDNPTPDQIAAIERYVKYVVDRWGPYVDFWELMNEATASVSWYEQVGAYLKRIDPYHHPVSTSWEEPSLPVIDISSPHWYENESQFASDTDTWSRMMSWKQAGKPVMVGEQGNVGRNWYPDSAVRMRLRAWTAFFAEGTLIFWNASFAKDDVGNAIYLGPQERAYLKVLQSFTGGFDPRARMTSISLSEPSQVRGYGVSGPRGYAAYIVASTNHATATRGVRVAINPRLSGRAVWIAPATGQILRRGHVHAGNQSLAVPPFITDVALKITR